MGGTPILSDLAELTYQGINFFLYVLDQVFKGLKGSGNFIFQNFPYDKPNKILTLFVGFFIVVLVLLLFLIVGGGMFAVGLGGVVERTGDSGGGNIIKAGFSGSGPGSGAVVSGSSGGLPSLSFDVDGDGIPNEDDLTPCGSSSCGGSYPLMCGNGQCQTFKTSAVYAYDERMTEFCPGPMFFYNIPAYCLKSKAQAYKLTVWYSDEYQVYNDAACFDSVSVVLNPRCLVLNDSIYYSENNANCPKDCNSSLSCFKDYTCVDNPYNCPSAFECCAPGSVRAGTCQDWGMCDIGGFTDSVLSLRNVPVHCVCSSDLDCLNDHGGLTCCPGGSVHAGFCYSDPIFCDST